MKVEMKESSPLKLWLGSHKITSWFIWFWFCVWHEMNQLWFIQQMDEQLIVFIVNVLGAYDDTHFLNEYKEAQVAIMARWSLAHHRFVWQLWSFLDLESLCSLTSSSSQLMFGLLQCSLPRATLEATAAAECHDVDSF